MTSQDAFAHRTSPRVALWALAFANFVIGMGAFMAIGVLTPMAQSFGVDKATAGWVLTSYAIVYGVTSPLLVALTGDHARRWILGAGLTIFGFGAALAAISPSFGFLLAARAVMAIGGGLTTPVAASVGVAMVAPGMRGQALATIFGGLTLAQVLGIPAGAWLGYAYGWQTAFVGVAALSALGVALVARVIPGDVAVPRASLSTLASVVGDARLVFAVLFTALFIAGLYSFYTYMTPFLEARFALGRDGVTAMLLLFGAGAVVGNAVGGAMADRIGPEPTLIVLCLSQIVVAPVLSGSDFSLAWTAALVAVWSVCCWSFMAPQQARLAAMDPPRTPVLFALNAAALYVGGALGSLIGGQLLTRVGVWSLGLGTAALAVAAIASISIANRFSPRPRP